MHELNLLCRGTGAGPEEMEWFVQLLLLFSFKDTNSIEQEVASGRYYTPDRQPPARARDLSVPCFKWGMSNIPALGLWPATTAIKGPCYIQPEP